MTADAVHRTARIATLLGVVSGCVGCDQATKVLAQRALGGAPPVQYLGDLFRLQYVENRGAFLSLGATLPDGVRSAVFVFGVAVVLAVLLGHVLLSRRVQRGELLAAALVVGGGTGNLIDRVLLGHVRDFANLGIGPVRTGVFNVADVAITAGCALLLVHVLASLRADRHPGPETRS